MILSSVLWNLKWRWCTLSRKENDKIKRNDKIMGILYFASIYITIICWILCFVSYIGCLIYKYSNIIPGILFVISYVMCVLVLILMVIMDKKMSIAYKRKILNRNVKSIPPNTFKSHYKTYKQFANEIDVLMEKYNHIESKKIVKKDISFYIKSRIGHSYSIIIVYHVDKIDSKNKNEIFETMNNYINKNIKGLKIGGLQLTYIVCTNGNGKILNELLSETKIFFDRPYTHKAIVGVSILDNEIYLLNNYELLIKGLYKKIKKYLSKNFEEIIK